MLSTYSRDGRHIRVHGRGTRIDLTTSLQHNDANQVSCTLFANINSQRAPPELSLKGGEVYEYCEQGLCRRVSRGAGIITS